MKKAGLYVTALAFALAGFGCSGSVSSGDVKDSTVKEDTADAEKAAEPAGTVDAKDLTAKEAALTAADVPEVSADDMKKYGDALNAFSHEFEAQYAGAASYVFSPFSYHSALSMAAFGAKGATYDEMAKVLHFAGNAEDAASLNGGMRLKLRFDGQNEASKLEIANRIWVEQTAEVVPAFDDGMARYYKAPLKLADFKQNYSEYLGVINTWVSNNTSNMIQNLLENDALTDLTRMVLVNAIRFDGKWEYPFEPFKTKNADFHVSADSTVPVRMMSLADGLVDLYRSDEGQYTAVSLDYEGKTFGMLIVLPDEIEGLSTVAPKLDGAVLRGILDGLKPTPYKVSIPKFKIETEVDIQRNKAIFSALGMATAFGETADFSGMLTGEDIKIGAIVHKAIIEVDEAGTKASAATAVAAVANSADLDVKRFVADHPFEYVLYHKASGAVLFAGQFWGK